MVEALPRGWCGTDLGSYRACPATYLVYPYDDQPVLDERALTGGYPWLGDPGGVDEKSAARMSSLDKELRDAGFALPDDFVTFYSHRNFKDALDAVSVTACYTDLSASPIIRPEAPWDRMVRFLRDQQDCVFWYLYFRPDQDPCVVFSFVDHSAPEEWPQVDPQESQVTWCAPSFQHFAYRYWLESYIWAIVNGETTETLTGEMRAYLDQLGS